VVPIEPADVAQPSTQYKPADLHITLKDTKADITKYGNAYRAIVADYAASTTANVPQLLFSYLENGDAQALAKINQVKIISASTVRRLAELNITSSAAFMTVREVNTTIALSLRLPESSASKWNRFRTTASRSHGCWRKQQHPTPRR
jgi:hypothetical protein